MARGKQKFPAASAEWWSELVQRGVPESDSLEFLRSELREGVAVEPVYWQHPEGPRFDRGGEPTLTSFIAGSRGEMLDRLAEATAGGVEHFWIGSATAQRDAGVLADLVRAVGAERTLEIASWVQAASVSSMLGKHKNVELALDPFQAAGPMVLERSNDAVSAYQSSESARWVASTMPFHAAGADAADEIGYALSTILEFARWCDSASPDTAPLRVTVRVGLRQDVFVEIAKLRALRVCLDKLGAAIAGSGLGVLVHGITSPRVQTLLDPWSNVLRSGAGAFAAIVGGADRVTVLAHDRRFGWTEQGERLARNVFHLLCRESYLGLVNDPAGGSYYLESLTDRLARTAWERMQEVESLGGLSETLVSGWLTTRLHERHHELAQRLAQRSELRIGVNTFAVAREEFDRMNARRSLQDYGFDDGDFDGLRRRAARLRAQGIKPRIAAVVLGAERANKPQVAWLSDVAASAGVDVTTEPSASKVACWIGTADKDAPAPPGDYELEFVLHGEERAGCETLSSSSDIVIAMNRVLAVYEGTRA